MAWHLRSLNPGKPDLLSHQHLGSVCKICIAHFPSCEWPQEGGEAEEGSNWGCVVQSLPLHRDKTRKVTSPAARNRVHPKVIVSASAYSRGRYVFLRIRVPHTMAGIILALLPIVCTGKETWRRASYWQAVARTLEAETAAYACRGAAGRTSSFFTC